MAVGKRRFTEAERLDIQAWPLPELDGPKVHEEDALGNRLARDARRKRRREPHSGEETPAETPVISTEETFSEEDYQLPSAAELQAMRDEARAEGLQEGREAGREEGYAVGHEEGVKAGHEEGYAAGHEEGLAAAREQVEREIEDARQAVARQFAQAIQAVNSYEADLENELAPVLTNLVLRMTQGLVVQSLQQTPEQIEDIVHQAIQLMPSAQERMQVLLNPEDCSMLKGLELHWLRQIDLQADEELSPGGCVVKTAHSLLDYTLEQRYQKQIQALLDQPEGQFVPEPLRTLSAERFKALMEESEAAADVSFEPASKAPGDSVTESDEPDEESSEAAQDTAKEAPVADDDPESDGTPDDTPEGDDTSEDEVPHDPTQ